MKLYSTFECIVLMHYIYIVCIDQGMLENCSCCYSDMTFKLDWFYCLSICIINEKLLNFFGFPLLLINHCLICLLFVSLGLRLALKVTLSCVVKKELSYTKATPTFHHWRIQGERYGLTFHSSADAQVFEKCITKVAGHLRESRRLNYVQMESMN